MCLFSWCIDLGNDKHWLGKCVIFRIAGNTAQRRVKDKMQSIVFNARTMKNGPENNVNLELYRLKRIKMLTK